MVVHRLGSGRFKVGDEVWADWYFGMKPRVQASGPIRLERSSRERVVPSIDPAVPAVMRGSAGA
jgi:hypothetical protein